MRCAAAPLPQTPQRRAPLTHRRTPAHPAHFGIVAGHSVMECADGCADGSLRRMVRHRRRSIRAARGARPARRRLGHG